MKIGQHRLHHFEFETSFGIWIDEKVGGRWACDNGSSAGTHGVFQGSDRCCANSDDATRCAKSAVDGIGCAGGDRVTLRMDLVIFDALDVDGLESSQADVQGDFDGLDAAPADAIEDFWGEMQAGGGSRYRSTLLGIDGLVTFAIVRRIGARDIRRERDVAEAIKSREKIVFALRDGLKADAALAEFPAGKHLGLQLVVTSLAEEQAFSNTDLAAGTDQAFPIIGICRELARQEDFDSAAQKIPSRRISRADRLSASAFAAAIKARGKNAGVVENYHIVGAQQIREVAEQTIGIAASSLQVQHAAAVASGEGFLGD